MVTERSIDLDGIPIFGYTYMYMDDKKLTGEGYLRAAAKFRLLADPCRLRILDLLRREGELTVNEVGERIACSQPTASRQLSKLFDAHMVSRRRERNTVFYFIHDDSVFELCEAICGRLEREAETDINSLYETAEQDD